MNTRPKPDTLKQLSARFSADEAASFGGEDPFLTERRLAGAVEAIGWRSATDAPVELVVGYLSVILDACVNGHRDLTMLNRDIADCLRYLTGDEGDSHNVSNDWDQAAARIVTLYARGQSPVEAW